MNALARILHVFAVGLWFGMGVFFSFVVGPSLFGSFEEISAKDEDARPYWFPTTDEFEQHIEGAKLPEPLRKEQGSRAAGFAIGPLFDWYFAIQLGCAAVALLCAVAWLQPGARLARVRVVILVLALIVTAGGYALERKVNELGRDRQELTELLLRGALPDPEATDAAKQQPVLSPEQLSLAKANTAKARATFGMWHGISMLVNLITLLLVAGALALTAYLPPPEPRGGNCAP